MGQDAPAHLLISTGGMPSSHTGVTSLFMALLIEYDVESPLVAISGVYASLIINDAVKVRRQSGNRH